MKTHLFQWDGKLMGLLEKGFDVITLSVLWILGCLPVITVFTSTSALYYGVAKSLRRGLDHPAKEFWRSYRLNMFRGIILQLTVTVPGWLLIRNIRMLTVSRTQPALLTASVILLILILMAATYISPVLSRFSISLSKIGKLSFLMSIRFLPDTLWIGLGTLALGMLQIYLFPIPLLAIWPALWCLLVTCRMEKCLQTYMPPKEADDQAWYYQ